MKIAVTALEYVPFHLKIIEQCTCVVRSDSISGMDFESVYWP